MVKNYTSLIINFLRQATADHCSRDAQNDERQKKLPVVAGSFLEYAFPGSLRRSARITGADPPRNQYTTVKKLVAAKLGASRIRGRHAAVEIVRGPYRDTGGWIVRGSVVRGNADDPVVKALILHIGEANPGCRPPRTHAQREPVGEPNRNRSSRHHPHSQSRNSGEMGILGP